MIKFRSKPTPASVVGVLVLFVISSFIAFKHQHIIHANTLLRLSLLVAVAFVSLFFLFVEPIAQPQQYHDFADKRLFLCSCHSQGLFLPPTNDIDGRRNNNQTTAGFIIPNFGDVVSNIVILIGGLSGALLLHRKENGEIDDSIRNWQLEICLPIFFYSTIAISFGSSYYHWNPNNKTLIWDRLPMTLAFVSIFCYMLEDYVFPNEGIGISLLSPLLVLGIVSVMYWNYTDDLRLYALVQFFPLFVMAFLLIFCQPCRYGGAVQQALALLLYALAKISEDKDYQIWALTKKTISGHSVKHILAGLASLSIASILISNEEALV